jgi:holo-[acyl-carrier protein] synthase
VSPIILGVGIDIIELERIHSRSVERLAGRILMETERRKMPHTERRKLEYVAGRFAAKEAVAKAIGTGIGQALGFLDIEINANKQGVPQVKLSAQSKHALFAEKEVKIHLSISHSEQMVGAVAVIEEIFA